MSLSRLGGIIEPLGLTLLSLVTFAAPASVTCPASITIVEGLGVALSVPPAFCSIAISLLWSSSIARFMSSPVVSSVSVAETVARSTVCFRSFAFTDEDVETSAASFPRRWVAIVPGTISPWASLVAEVAAHLAVKTLGPFRTKAFARLDRVPAIAILIAISSTSRGVWTGFTEAVALDVASIASISPAHTSRRIAISGRLVPVRGLVSSSGGEGCSRRAKDYIFWICETE